MTDRPLPTLAEVRDRIIPEAAALLPTVPFTPASNVLLLAIGLQESRFKHRQQIKGPARGFWQFEAGGGTEGVLRHPRTQHAACQLARERIDHTRSTYVIHAALAEDDVLACGFARLLLWADPKPLPRLGEVEQAWFCYLRNWRPGKPHRQTWDGLYGQALKAIQD